MTDEALIGLPTAMFEPPPVPVRVTELLAADWLPAASFARTKYVTWAEAGWVSV